MGEIHFWEIDRLKYNQWLDELMPLLEAGKIDRVLQYKQPVDRLLAVCAEALVSYLICRRLDLKNSEIKKINMENHTYIIIHYFCSVSLIPGTPLPSGGVGIDIERISTAKEIVSERFFLSMEREHLRLSLDRDQTFYEIWTRKESYLKYLGQGLSREFVSSDVFSPEISGITGTFIHNGYCISVCGHGFLPMTFYQVDYKNILEMGVNGM